MLTEDDVEFERESLRFVVGARVGTVIFDQVYAAVLLLDRHGWNICDDISHELSLQVFAYRLFSSP